MTEQPRTPYLGQYVLILIAATAGIFVLRLGAASLFDVELGAGGLALLPPLLGAIFCGRKWAMERGSVPQANVAWRWAIVAGIAFLALQILLTPLVLINMGGALDGSAATVLVLGLALFTAIAIFVNRFFLVMGARGVLKNPGK
ncbi:ABZJ_00895 family protein [Pontivivens insulae]|uniref:Transmembrane protein n=1 Tax=Pontivivens insulae TaxID=1639689 RepID=A0A2R8ABI1_9RHOB|nr:ABZJ_00895 family protein [Pontivivens insulae]RED11256.1 hypothetical protein DFR53_3289 [Pontivivens insulae]SPF29571.1 hypothetical protein POI8812_01884 [Pontivivens insulae]